MGLTLKKLWIRRLLAPGTPKWLTDPKGTVQGATPRGGRTPCKPLGRGVAFKQAEMAFWKGRQRAASSRSKLLRVALYRLGRVSLGLLSPKTSSCITMQVRPLFCGLAHFAISRE